MGIKVLTGGSGYGKTYYMNKQVIEKSMAHPEKNYIVVVPEQFTMQTQKDLCMAHPNGGLINIDIVSFKRLALRVFGELGMNMPEFLDDTGKNLILRRVIEEKKNELKVFRNKARYIGFVEQVKSAVSELSQYSIDGGQLESMINQMQSKPLLQAKLQDIALIYKSFNEYTKDKYITKEDILKVLTEEIYRSSVIKNSTIYFDGFTGFTPVQYSLIERLAEYAEDVLCTVTIDNENMETCGEYGFLDVKEQELFKLSKDTINKLNEIAVKVHTKLDIVMVHRQGESVRLSGTKQLSYLEQNLFRYREAVSNVKSGEIKVKICRNYSEEAEMIAYSIARAVRNSNIRYRDVAVVTGDMDSYAVVLAEALERYDIPYFMDNKKSIMRNPFVCAIRYMLLVLEENFSFDSVMRYLKSGMSSMSQNDIYDFENYIDACGIKGYKRYHSEWKTKKFCPKNVTKEMLTAIDENRGKLMDLYEPLKEVAISKSSTVLDITKEIYNFIIKENMEKKLLEYSVKLSEQGNMALQLEYSQIYGAVMNLLDKLVELLGDEHISIREYIKILDSGLQEIKVSIIPPAIDQVVIGDITRTRLNDIKGLFFAGVNDGVIPSSGNSADLLSQSDRVMLKKNGMELSPTMNENMFIQRLYLYMMMTKPSKQLIMSYSIAAVDGSAMRPSYIISTLTSMFSELKVERIHDKGFDIYTKKAGLRHLDNELYRCTYNTVDKLSLCILAGFIGDDEYTKYIKQLKRGLTYRNEVGSIGKAVARALYGTNISGNVTRLENYAACAYAHFLQYGLRLSEQREFEVNRADIGSIYHEIIENFFQKIKEYKEENRVSWRDIDDSVRKKIVDLCMEDIKASMQETSIYADARSEYFFNRIARVTDRISEILVDHVNHGKFEPKYYELSFGMDGNFNLINIPLSDDVTMRLQGKIDRVDVVNFGDTEYVKIIDYKSGKKEFDLQDVYAGTNIQMVMYLEEYIHSESSKGKDVRPGAALYFHIDDPIIDLTKDDVRKKNKTEEDIRNTIYSSYKMDGLLNLEERVVKSIDDRLIENDSESYIIDAVNIKGTLSKKSRSRKESILLSEKAIYDIMDKVNDIVVREGKEIISGECSMNPVVVGKSDPPCVYCKYMDICQFDEKNDGNKYRVVKAEEEE